MAILDYLLIYCLSEFEAYGPRHRMSEGIWKWKTFLNCILIFFQLELSRYCFESISNNFFKFKLLFQMQHYSQQEHATHLISSWMSILTAPLLTPLSRAVWASSSRRPILLSVEFIRGVLRDLFSSEALASDFFSSFFQPSYIEWGIQSAGWR